MNNTTAINHVRYLVQDSSARVSASAITALLEDALNLASLARQDAHEMTASQINIMSSATQRFISGEYTTAETSAMKVSDVLSVHPEPTQSTTSGPEMERVPLGVILEKHATDLAANGVYSSGTPKYCFVDLYDKNAGATAHTPLHWRVFFYPTASVYFSVRAYRDANVSPALDFFMSENEAYAAIRSAAKLLAIQLGKPQDVVDRITRWVPEYEATQNGVASRHG